MQATAERLADVITDDAEFSRLERRNRILGRLALAPENRLRNNDPLAHVFLRLETRKFADIETQVRAEYHSDMSERSEITSREVEDSGERPFYAVFDYRLEGDDLIYTETGKSLNELLGDGVTAAETDHVIDKDGYTYHLARAKVLASHGPAMVHWRKQNPQHTAMIASLCPSAKELAPQIAKLGNFKVNRSMASNWLLEPTPEGIRVLVFSLDKLDLAGLQYIYDSLGVDVRVHETTLDEVGEIRSLNTNAIAGWMLRKITDIHDNRLDEEFPQNGPHFYGIKKSAESIYASTLVERRPEAETLYRDAIEEVAQSLMAAGNITPGLGKILMELRSAFPSADKLPLALQLGGKISLDQAREFMQYLLSQALPEYIFGDRKQHQQFREQNNLVSDTGGGGYSGVASAGSYATANGISREGACPSSAGGLANQNSAEHANSAMAAALGLHSEKKEFKSKWCPNCLPEPQRGRSVKAWRKGDRIGCSDCGREEDICTKRVVRGGKRIERYKNIAFGTVDIIVAGWRRLGAQIRLDKLRKQRAASAERGEQKQLDQLITQKENEIAQLRLVT